MNAGDLTEMLRRHYLPEGRVPAGFFAAEVGSPDGKRRADALWLPTTVHTGSGIVGHEVKVSRADVLVELADPAKADPWAKYCDRWWLVVSDPAFVDRLMIPNAWGVMAPPSGRLRRTMTVLRPAPQLHPIDPSPGFRRLVAWQMANYGQRAENAEWALKREQETTARLRTQLEELRFTGGNATNSPPQKRIANILWEAQKRIRDEQQWFLRDDIDDQVIVDALVDAAVTRQAAQKARRDLECLIEQMERDLEPMRYARELLVTATKHGLESIERMVPAEIGEAQTA